MKLHVREKRSIIFLWLVRHFGFYVEFPYVIYSALTKAQFFISCVAVINEIVNP